MRTWIEKNTGLVMSTVDNEPPALGWIIPEGGYNPRSWQVSKAIRCEWQAVDTILDPEVVVDSNEHVTKYGNED